MCFHTMASGYQSLMYWCDVCGKEIPAATVRLDNGAFFHRKGAENAEEHREGDLHPVRKLAETHEVTLPPSEAFNDQ